MVTPEQFNLNVIPNGITPVCHVSQYDESRQILVNLFYGNEPYVFESGVEAVIAVRKPDGHIVTAQANYTVGQSNLTFNTTKQMCAVAGKNLCEVQLIWRNGQTVLQKLYSLNFIMDVEKDPIDGGLTSESEIHDLEQQIANITTQQMGNYYTKAESDARYLTTADVYTKSQIDDVVNEINYNKADKSDVYTKDDVDGFLATKADSDDVYTKDEVDEELAFKADKFTTYTKIDVDELLADKANISQIIITDGYSDYSGPINPTVDDVYQVKTESGSSISLRAEPNTTSEIEVQVPDEKIIDVSEIVTGELIHNIPTWVHATYSRYTGYINTYYVRPFYEDEFTYNIASIDPNNVKIQVKPYQMGTGDPSPSNQRIIHSWEYIDVIVNDIKYHLELPLIMYGGWVELMDDTGYGSSDYVYIDLGDLTWSRPTGVDTDPVVAQNAATDIEFPEEPEDIADIYCEKLKPDSEYNTSRKVTDMTIAVAENLHGFIVYSSDLDGLTPIQVKSALSGIKLLYKTTEPMDFTFSGFPTLSGYFKTRVGTNTVLANCGPILDIKVKNAKVPADIVILTGTLEAGETTLELQNAALTDDSIIDLYTNAYGVNPTDVTVTTGSITLTFDAQESDLGVKVVIK